MFYTSSLINSTRDKKSYILDTTWLECENSKSRGRDYILRGKTIVEGKRLGSNISSLSCDTLFDGNKISKDRNILGYFIANE
jgi:hypothetical protein